MNKQFMAISPDGSLHQCQITMTPKTTNLEDYLQTKADKVEVFTHLTKGYHIGSRRGNQTLALVLDKLVFSTYFRLGKTDDVCVFALEKGDVNVRGTLTAKLPDDMVLVIMRMPDGEMFLIALSKKDGNIYKLPLPNIYKEGRICMGEDYNPDDCTTSADESFKYALEVFNDAVWNTDLTEYSTIEERESMWRWDLDSDSENCDFIPMDRDWENLCQPLSNSEFNGMAKHILKCSGYRPEQPNNSQEPESSQGFQQW